MVSKVDSWKGVHGLQKLGYGARYVARTLRFEPSLVGVICNVLGIYACFLTQGIAQESIYKMDVGEGAKFKYPVFLVSLVCTFCAAFGYLLTKVENGKAAGLVPTAMANPSQHRDLLTQGFYVSLSYIGSMIATNFSLTRVPYPMQVLVKSAKAVPVVVGGVVFFGKRYHYSDYVTVACVTLSLVLFQAGNLAKRGGNSTWAGLGALCIALIFDGMTGPRQDRMVEKWHLKTGDLMLLINAFSAPVGWVCSLAVEGQAPWSLLSERAVSLLPRVLLYILCGAFGQMFIVRVLRDLGSLHLTLITTSRKFLGILLSVILFGHALNLSQWLAVVLLLSSAFIKRYLGPKARSTHVAQKKHPKKTEATDCGL